MNQQISLFAFSYTSFSPEQKQTLLTNPQAGAQMAVFAVDDLFSYLIKVYFLSLENPLRMLREKVPDPKNDMLHWLNFIQRYPYLLELRLDDQGKFYLKRAEFLLTVVHLVAWGAIAEADFMFGGPMLPKKPR